MIKREKEGKSSQIGKFVSTSRDDKEAEHTGRRLKDISDVDSGTNKLIPLPLDYVPSTFDVVCGTGKDARRHYGNKTFQKTLQSYIAKYSTTTCKLEKSLLISEIMNTVRDSHSEGGGFIKRIGEQWFALGTHLSREKVSQGLRDLLHKQYRSSNIAKKRRRLKLCTEFDNNIDEMLEARKFVTRRIEKVARDVRNQENIMSDDEICGMFTRANLDILEALKQDDSLLTRVGEMNSTLGADNKDGDESSDGGNSVGGKKPNSYCDEEPQE